MVKRRQLIRFFISLLFWLFLIALLDGCSFLRNRTNKVKFTSLPLAEKQINPSVLWTSLLKETIDNFNYDLHPAIYNGLVYVANKKGIVKALDVSNGQEIWSITLEEKTKGFSKIPALLSSGLSTSNGRIYLGSEKAKVYALNSNNGAMAWKAQAAGEVLSDPVIEDDIVLIHTSNSQLQAFDEANGALKWTLNLGDTPTFSLRGESAPAIAFGVAIIGNDNGLLSAILIQQGQIIWQQNISRINGNNEMDRLKDIDVTPVIVDEIVYAIGYIGDLTALDLRSGQILWKRELGSIHNFIVNNNRIYLIDRDNRLLALDTTNKGATLWIQSDLSDHLLTAPLLYKGHIILADSKGFVYWIDSVNGRLIAQKKIDDSGFFTSPIVDDNKLLIQSKNGMLYAINC